MKQTAIVIAPGRGTYNAAELGYLQRHHSSQAKLLNEFDSYRQSKGQETLSALDGSKRFSRVKHTTGDNASALIYACGYFDFLAIDRDRFDIIGVTGNSMGWYSALVCAGGLTPLGGLDVVNTMGALMQSNLLGGQLIYPFVDENWQPVAGLQRRILDKVVQINRRADMVLDISINLGGMLVLAGNSAGLDAFADEMPRVQDRFPMHLLNHAAFHTEMQTPVAAKGRALLPRQLFRQPDLPLIDGRGAIWQPHCCDMADLWSYTLNHQVVQTYDFTSAIQVAAKEFMPDVFIVLGPGGTLGGAVAQSLTACKWRGMDTKSAFKQVQAQRPNLISMGDVAQRAMVALRP